MCERNKEKERLPMIRALDESGENRRKRRRRRGGVRGGEIRTNRKGGGWGKGWLVGWFRTLLAEEAKIDFRYRPRE